MRRASLRRKLCLEPREPICQDKFGTEVVMSNKIKREIETGQKLLKLPYQLDQKMHAGQA